MALPCAKVKQLVRAHVNVRCLALFPWRVVALVMDCNGFLTANESAGEKPIEKGGPYRSPWDRGLHRASLHCQATELVLPS